ncbi:MAG: hypothetical protein IJ870_07045 [Alphaproteobacteria bacterium]|nr:hypothetical protein [Alphaproteobacteria bacterium]
MIEIAFDEHSDNSFKGQTYPLLDVPDLDGEPFSSYLSFADSVFKKYTSELYLIVLADCSRFDTNKLAFAFFIQSCLHPNNALECVVFKTSDTKLAFESYKPYIAASIGIKYALRIAKENVFEIYKELKCLNYLNFTIKESFLNHTLVFTPNNVTTQNIETHSVFEAVVFVSLLKILSLAEIDMPFSLTVFTSTEPEKIDSKLLLKNLLEKTSHFIDL